MMSRTVRVALVLVLALTACHNKQQALTQPPLAPPIVDQPLPPPDKAPADLPPPVITVPQEQQPAPEAQESPPPPPPKPKHHKPKGSSPADQQNTQLAQNNAPPQVSAEGNFTPMESADMRKETSDSIAQTEKGILAITRKLNEQEQKTRAQVLEFLKQAKAAMNTGDVDGAHTLAVKAKVLLGELVQ